MKDVRFYDFEFNRLGEFPRVISLNFSKKYCGYGTSEVNFPISEQGVIELLEDNKQLPFQIKNSVIYYAGPTPTPENLPIGSCGPTTSSRMDVFTPLLLDNGLCAMIGKGQRSDTVVDSIKKNKALYFCAIGGAGALCAMSVKKLEVIAFEELGCESVKKLTVEEFPVICTIDCTGGNMFERK